MRQSVAVGFPFTCTTPTIEIGTRTTVDRAPGGDISWLSLLLLPPAALLASSLAATFAGFVVLAAERGEAVHLSARLLSTYLREATSRTLMIALTPLGLWQRFPAAIVANAEVRPVPVLLLHDDQWNRASMGFLRTFLVYRGFKWVWAANWCTGDMSIAEHAETVGKLVGDLMAASGAAKIDVVGHGTGGLVAAWYVRHLGGADHVRRLVTLGTPWKGTKMAVFRPGRLSVDIGPGAPILDGLTPPPVSTTCVWSPDDPAIVPSSSALPDTGVDSVCLDGCGHLEMLLSARAFRSVKAALPQPLTKSQEGT